MGIKQLLGIGKQAGATELLVRAATLLIVKRVQGSEISTLNAMKEMEAKIMAVLDDVLAKVADMSSVTASAATLIDGLQDKLDAALKEVKAGYEPEKLEAIIKQLEADKLKLIEAMKENTIAIVEPSPPPVADTPAPAPEPVVDAAPVVEPAPVEAPAEPAPAPEPAPAEPQKFDEWGNPIS